MKPSKALWPQMCRLLLTPRRTVWRHALGAGIGSALLAMALAQGLLGLLWLVGVDPASLPGTQPAPTPGFVAGALFLAPWLETLVLAAGLWLISLGSSRPVFVAATAAVLAGLAHGPHPVAVLGVGAAFFVFACCYLAWRPVGLPQALWACGLAHMVHNGVVTGVVLGLATGP